MPRLVLKRVPTGAGLKLSNEYRRGDNRHSVSSIQKMAKIGWRPRRGLAVIMDDFLEWIERIGGVPQQVPDAQRNMRDAGVVLTAAY